MALRSDERDLRVLATGLRDGSEKGAGRAGDLGLEGEAGEPPYKGEREAIGLLAVLAAADGPRGTG